MAHYVEIRSEQHKEHGWQRVSAACDSHEQAQRVMDAARRASDERAEIAAELDGVDAPAVSFEWRIVHESDESDESDSAPRAETRILHALTVQLSGSGWQSSWLQARQLDAIKLEHSRSSDLHRLELCWTIDVRPFIDLGDDLVHWLTATPDLLSGSTEIGAEPLQEQLERSLAEHGWRIVGALEIASLPYYYASVERLQEQPAARSVLA